MPPVTHVECACVTEFPQPEDAREGRWKGDMLHPLLPPALPCIRDTGTYDTASLAREDLYEMVIL